LFTCDNNRVVVVFQLGVKHKVSPWSYLSSCCKSFEKEMYVTRAATFSEKKPSFAMEYSNDCKEKTKKQKQSHLANDIFFKWSFCDGLVICLILFSDEPLTWGVGVGFKWRKRLFRIPGTVQQRSERNLKPKPFVEYFFHFYFLIRNEIEWRIWNEKLNWIRIWKFLKVFHPCIYIYIYKRRYFELLTEISPPFSAFQTLLEEKMFLFKLEYYLFKH